MRLAGKKVLITGGSSGIGLALVDACLAEGARVAFTHRSEQALERREVVRLLERTGRVYPIRADFSSPGRAEDVVAQAARDLEGIDVLINNAAAFSRQKLLETDCETLSHILNVNLVAPFLMVRAFASQSAARAARGSIINISSLSATVARSEMAAYQCSKAALEMLSTSAAYEFAALGVRSNVIAPGLTETEANQPQRATDPGLWAQRVSSIPMGRAGRPVDLVGAALFLASDESEWVTGAKIVVDGGSSTF